MVSSIPNNPDQLLPRVPTATALTEAGFPIAPATLATMATRGGGPPYQSFGVKPLYRWGDAIAWAQARLGAPRCNTSEADATDRAISQPHRRGRPSKAQARTESTRAAP
jgi:hypothetical protein